MGDRMPDALSEIRIENFTAGDEDGLFGLILPIQREEFAIAITDEQQPDLKEVQTFYQSGTGGFWVAKCENRIVGSIGLKDIGDREAALRKMFVAAEFRGRQHGVATALLDTLLKHAEEKGIKSIYLGTTDKFLAAHRFYEKHGFAEVGKTTLPPGFPVMAVDSKFYVKRLAA